MTTTAAASNTSGQGQLAEFTDLGASGENNNSASISFDAAENLYADLVVSQFSGPLTGRGGDTIRLDWTVLNQGGVITLADVKKHLQPELQLPGSSLPVVLKDTMDEPGDYRNREILLRALAEIKSDIIDLRNYIYTVESRKGSGNGKADDFTIPKERMNSMNFDEIEKEVLHYLLKENNWNVNRVSDILDQSPRNIYRKINKYNIREEE